ncbi:homeodomain-interacting protein kinase 4, partial [Austrofundulus limnaeus]|uniref:Homeodomain-interacting protein kinase 4 n=1 Tax=Austrofundulus limnaeus TaxID=52670 RepID=A0A2I4AMM1_AUSLI
MNHLPYNSNDSYVKNNPEGNTDLIAFPKFKSRNLMSQIREGFTICNKSDVYHVEKILGKGSYGLVAMCRINERDQRVALKVVSKEDVYSAKIEKEAILQLRKFDPDQFNIMNCFDCFEFEGDFCFAFELLDRSLADFMEERHWAPLKVSEIRAIAKQLLVSLTALEEVKMTHTDIKLDNLMLVDHTSTPFKVKLIDFGLTHFTSDLHESVILQAPGYRAPEVFLGLLPNEAVDIWGLGVSLGELYLGQMVFSEKIEREILRSAVGLLGQPDKFVLDRACRATHYFTLHDTDSEITWKIKPARKHKRTSGERDGKETN